MKERVQLNLSVTLEQKLALQALAEGHGTSVTKLVLGLIEQGSSPSVVVKSAEEWREAAEDEAVVQIEAAVGEVQGASPHSEDLVSGGGPVKAATADRAADVPVAGSSPAGPLGVIKSPAEVPGAVRRVASPEEARAFTPYSKATQVVRPKKAKAEPVATCRHGLLRCKVCGTL